MGYVYLVCNSKRHFKRILLVIMSVHPPDRYLDIVMDIKLSKPFTSSYKLQKPRGRGHPVFRRRITTELYSAGHTRTFLLATVVNVHNLTNLQRSSTTNFAPMQIFFFHSANPICSIINDKRTALK